MSLDKVSTPNQRPITAEDLYQLRTISGVRLSPDGQAVVYSAQRINPDTEKKAQNLWIAPVDHQSEYQFTFGDAKDVSPRWSPDGQMIAFLSNRQDPDVLSSLYLIPFHGGEARLLTEFKGKVTRFVWSPDGTRIVCTVRKFDPDEIARKEDEAKKKLGVVSRHYDRLFYKLDGDGYFPKERTHLWLVDVSTGNCEQLTDHPVFDELDPCWSPDGSELAFISNHSAEPDQFPDRIDLFVMPSQGGLARLIETPVGDKESPSFSPDGKWLAYFGKMGEGDWYRNTHLWIVPADGSQPAHDLLEGIDLHVDAATINDLGTPELMSPVWSVDGNQIYFQAVEHGSTHLYSVTVESQEIEKVIAADGVVAEFSFDLTQKKLAYFFGQMFDPAQIFVRDLASGKTRQITHINQELLAGINLGEIEEVWFKGSDGNDLQGWILKPPGFDPNKKYPSIMEIHGGPLTQYGNFFMHEFYHLAANGYVVYFCNPRGGRGYGEAHAGAIWGGWGDADYADLMAWADYVEKLPYIDASRMGVTGGSYGGYMTVWIIGHTDRFKAAVTQRCVSNWVSMWGSSDLNWQFQEILGDVAPYENLELFWKHSPIAYIGNARTPTLVIHSENDLRCPIEQSEQVFVALKRSGVDTEFVRFPEEFHGLSRNGRTDRRVVRLNHIVRWFNKYLK